MTRGFVCRSRRGAALAALALIGAAAPSASAFAQHVTVADAQTAANAHSELFARPVTVRVDDVTIKEAVTTIAENAGVRLQFQAEALNAVRTRVTLHASQIALGKALGQVLQGTGLQAVAIDADLVMIRAAVIAPADGGIRGVVTDAGSKAPLAGAIVSIDGGKTTVRTDANGIFQVNDLAAGAHRVTVRRLGYQVYSTEATVRDDGTVMIAVALSSSGTRLQEVVTTATGGQERLKVANDVGTINADSLVRSTLVRNMSDLLTGHTPGVQATPSGGAVGAPTTIRIRGVTSPQLNNDPIVVIDGIRVNAQTTINRVNGVMGGTLPASQVNTGSTTLLSGAFAPSPLDQIDPNSIESIDVLKGPTATALYGPDASSGVIVVKTKRGQAGPWRYHVGSDYGWITPVKAYPLKWTGWGHPAGGGASAPTCTLASQASGACVFDSVTAFNPMNDARMTTLGTGYNRSVVADVSGGGSTVQGFLQGDYNDAVGQQRLSAIEARRLAAMRTNPVPSWMKRPNGQRNAHVTSRLDALFTPNFDVAATGNATYQTTRNDGNGFPGSGGFSNVYGPNDTLAFVPGENLGMRTTSTTKRVQGIGSARLQPISWLVLTGTAGLDYSLRDDQSLQRTNDCTVQVNAAACAGFHSAMHTEVTVPSFNIGATFTYNLTSWLSAHTALGEQFSRTSTYSLGVSADSLAFGQNLITGARPRTPTEARDETASAGWFAEEQFGINNRLFLTGSLRRDASSSFGRSAATPTFPKLGASWVVSDESFFPKQDIVTQLRLRTAYGESGKQGSQTDVLRSFLYTNGYVGTNVPILVMSGIGNAALEPQRDKEWEGGFDLSLYSDRATLTTTWYRKKSSNAIIAINLPPSPGAATPIQSANVGDIQNVGTEVNLSVRPIDTHLLSWTFNLGASSNRNKLLRSNDLTDLPGNAGDAMIVPGYPLFGLWQRPILGYNDLNGNGILEANEISFADSAVFVGSTDPKGSLNYANSFSFLQGRLTFNSLVTQVNGLARQLTQTGVRGQVDPTASLAEQAAALQAFTNNNGFKGEVSYVSLAELSASYTLPAAWARRFRSRSATLTLAGRNLALWTNYRGADPMTNTGTLGDGSSDNGTGLAQPKNWTMRVNLQF